MCFPPVYSTFVLTSPLQYLIGIINMSKNQISGFLTPLPVLSSRKTAAPLLQAARARTLGVLSSSHIADQQIRLVLASKSTQTATASYHLQRHLSPGGLQQPPVSPPHSHPCPPLHSAVPTQQPPQPLKTRLIVLFFYPEFLMAPVSFRRKAEVLTVAYQVPVICCCFPLLLGLPPAALASSLIPHTQLSRTLDFAVLCA